MNIPALKKLDRALVDFQKHLDASYALPAYEAVLKVRASVDREIVKLEVLRAERKERRAG